MMVQHHRKYKEIHGIDEVVMMERAEHARLHRRLRREGKCLIPTDKLRIISAAARYRTDKGKRNNQMCCQRYSSKLRHNKKNRIRFFETIDKNVLLIETILVHPNTGAVNYSSRFEGNHGKKLKSIYI